MKLQYLGTAATEGFPAAFCNCEDCLAARNDLQTEWRTRSQAMIDQAIFLDLPPETYVHAVLHGFDLSAIRAILVTHSHVDHFYAQELINRGYKFAQNIKNPTVSLYGNSQVLNVYHESTRREMRETVASGIQIHEVKPFQNFTIDKYLIHTLPATHMEQEAALLYCISAEKTIFYWNDTGLLAEECYRYLADHGVVADFVSLDCTFADDVRPHSLRHMGFAENCAVREKLVQYGLVKQNTQYYVTHFSHNSRPFRLRLEEKAKEYGFFAAHDGLSIEL